MNYLYQQCRALLLAAVVIVGAACVGNVFAQGETITDKRDGKKYRTVVINGKAWMAQNLNYKTGKSWCYGNKDANCAKYGRLYDWKTAKAACPAGWHLATHEELQALADYAGGSEVAGKKLKSKSGWIRDEEKEDVGTDEYGFSALPGGIRDDGGDFNSLGECGNWWTASETDAKNAWEWGLCGGDDQVFIQDGLECMRIGEEEACPKNGNKVYLQSVRCVKD